VCNVSLPVLLNYLESARFNIGMPVVQTGSWRLVGRSVYGHVITKFSRMGSLPHFSYPWCSTARASCTRVPLKFWSLLTILTDRTWLGQTQKFDFISWIYLFNITETSACQSFYVGKFTNSLQLTKSALLALYKFIPLIFNRNLCSLKTSITQIKSFFWTSSSYSLLACFS